MPLYLQLKLVEIDVLEVQVVLVLDHSVLFWLQYSLVWYPIVRDSIVLKLSSAAYVAHLYTFIYDKLSYPLKFN